LIDGWLINGQSSSLLIAPKQRREAPSLGTFSYYSWKLTATFG
jgi:hypothetical protein